MYSAGEKQTRFRNLVNHEEIQLHGGKKILGRKTIYISSR